MTEQLEKPSWYQDKLYDKNRTPEEWLDEFRRRDDFKRNDISKRPIKEQKNIFLWFMFDQKFDDVLTLLKPTPHQPIKNLSISDVFRMYHLLINTEWYKNHPERYVFESAIHKISYSNETLTDNEKETYFKMHETPWCAFHENHQQDGWYPTKDIAGLSGIPISLDPNYPKQDTSVILKKKLTAWVGKKQHIRLRFDSWQERKILAIFDLINWFKILRIEHTNIGLHRLIWPDGRFSKDTGEIVNPDDDIKESIGIMNRVINESIIEKLFIMCEDIKFKKEIPIT